MITVLPFPALSGVWWLETLSSAGAYLQALSSIPQGHGHLKSQGIWASGVMLRAWSWLLEFVYEVALC